MRLFAIASIFILATLLIGLGSHPQSAPTPNYADGITGPLDGQVFEGRLVSIDGSIDLQDNLQFADGHFWSAGCIKCSFLPGEYTANAIDGVVEFSGELGSDERGTFTYKGRVESGVIKVEIHWVRKRWYWTTERDYVFHGEIEMSAEKAIPLKAAWNRALGQPLQSCPI